MAKGKSKNKSSTNEILDDRNENEQHDNIDEVGHLLDFSDDEEPSYTSLPKGALEVEILDTIYQPFTPESLGSLSTSQSFQSTSSGPPSVPIQNLQNAQVRKPKIEILSDEVSRKDLIIGEDSLQKLRQFGHCKGYFEKMRFYKETSYQIRVYEDLTRTYDLRKAIEVVIRVYLMVLAEKPTHFNVLGEVMERIIEEGYMKIPNEALMTRDLRNALMKNKNCKEFFSKIGNTFKEKIKRICEFGTSGFKLQSLTNDLLSNMSHCVSNSLPLRLYQMEKTVARTQDGLIMMTVPTKDRHQDFIKDNCHQYQYELGRSNEMMNNYHVFSVFEAVCYQCGFYTWEDIQIYSFELLVPKELEAFVLFTLALKRATNVPVLSTTARSSNAKSVLHQQWYTKYLKIVTEDRSFYYNAPLFSTGIVDTRYILFYKTEKLVQDIIDVDALNIGDTNRYQRKRQRVSQESDEERMAREFVESKEDSRRYSSNY